MITKTSEIGQHEIQKSTVFRAFKHLRGTSDFSIKDYLGEQKSTSNRKHDQDRSLQLATINTHQQSKSLLSKASYNRNPLLNQRLPSVSISTDRTKVDIRKQVNFKPVPFEPSDYLPEFQSYNNSTVGILDMQKSILHLPPVISQSSTPIVDKLQNIHIQELFKRKEKNANKNNNQNTQLKYFDGNQGSFDNRESRRNANNLSNNVSKLGANLPNGTVKINRKKLPANKISDLLKLKNPNASLILDDQLSRAQRSKQSSMLGKYQTPVMKKNDKVLILNDVNRSTSPGENEENYPIVAQQRDMSKTSSPGQFKNYINFTSAINIQEQEQKNAFSQIKIRRQYQLVPGRLPEYSFKPQSVAPIVKEPPQKQLSQDEQQQQQQKLDEKKEIMEQEKSLMFVKVFKKVRPIRIKPYMQSVYKIQSCYPKHQPFAANFLVINFDGVLGYLDDHSSKTQVKIFLRPGFMTFMEQISQMFIISIVFPLHYKKTYIKQIIESFKDNNVVIFNVYREIKRPKFYTNIYDYQIMYDDFFLYDQTFNVENCIVVGSINKQISRADVRREFFQKADNLNLINGLTAISRQMYQCPVFILIQNMKVEADDESQSVSLSYLAQSLQYLNETKNQLLVEKKKNFKLKISPIENEQEKQMMNNSFDSDMYRQFSHTYHTMFDKLKQHSIHGLKAFDIRQEYTTFGRDLDFYESRIGRVKRIYQKNCLRDYQRTPCDIKPVYQNAYNDTISQLKISNIITQENRGIFLKAWKGRNQHYLNSHEDQHEILIKVQNKYSMRYKRTCECCKNKRDKKDLEYDEKQMACEFIKENYELDMSLKVIVFPSYLYPPITNTVMGIYKKKPKLLDIFNARD